ncbi:MAG: hypothetical protein Q8R42_09775 [Desulfocapsaceae bacterium]|jgi:hypothetical protein|nr:hypothetical protein [Desulfocapsaceae bacterium]
MKLVLFYRYQHPMLPVAAHCCLFSPRYHGYPGIFYLGDGLPQIGNSTIQ